MRRRIVHQWRWSRCVYGDVNGDEEVDDEDDYNDDNVNAGDDDIDKNKEDKNINRVSYCSKWNFAILTSGLHSVIQVGMNIVKLKMLR